MKKQPAMLKAVPINGVRELLAAGKISLCNISQLVGIARQTIAGLYSRNLHVGVYDDLENQLVTAAR